MVGIDRFNGYQYFNALDISYDNWYDLIPIGLERRIEKTWET